ncbi:MAG: hypothetical protein JO147_11815 [Actinobacteria bacterium]|nr:hypothetical protein [Actinomycetota bacterium]
MAIGVHAAGAGLIAANRARVALHAGSRQNTIVKSAITAAALASTAYSVSTALENWTVATLEK